MSEVLNDVLDFNRMDSGRFESVSMPYSFHTVLRSMLVPLQLAADARGLELYTDIDKRIDVVGLSLIRGFYLLMPESHWQIARKAWYQARGDTPEWIQDKLSQDPDEEGIVVGV